MLSRDQGKFIALDGLKTFYLKHGSGHPVVLIHGASPGACSLVNWKLNIEPLAAAGFSVYAFDQPGFGHTDNPEDYSLEYRVKHAAAFLKELRIERCHIIGNSQGCYIAARLALENPNGKLVLVSSGTLAPKGSEKAQAVSARHAQELRDYTPSLEGMRIMTQKTLFRQELVSDELVEERFSMSTGKNLLAQTKRREAPLPRSLANDLGALRRKTLILWGNNDQGAAVERALLLFQLIPDAELHIFDRCAHWVQWDQAARFNGLVADFLKDASA